MKGEEEDKSGWGGMDGVETQKQENVDSETERREGVEEENLRRV